MLKEEYRIKSNNIKSVTEETSAISLLAMRLKMQIIIHKVKTSIYIDSMTIKHKPKVCKIPFNKR
ncbi:hypothetical protein SHYC_00595 [Staphylococcus hyicus]|nr:hypothetical protein SHYC_00595 [Staphylococcus hyicus]SQE46427.1 Uncharacterised protein [Staphylococcus hyicus]